MCNYRWEGRQDPSNGRALAAVDSLSPETPTLSFNESEPSTEPFSVSRQISLEDLCQAAPVVQPATWTLPS